MDFYIVFKKRLKSAYLRESYEDFLNQCSVKVISK